MYVDESSAAQRSIAMVAHDDMKSALCLWAGTHAAILGHHRLLATGTTARLLQEGTALSPLGLESGPLGGDQQIGARIVEGTVDMLVFFSDPLTAHAHEADIQALIRIAILADIPMALNRASADCLMAALATPGRTGR